LYIDYIVKLLLTFFELSLLKISSGLH